MSKKGINLITIFFGKYKKKRKQFFWKYINKKGFMLIA